MTYYFISGGLPDNYGGLTKSLLLRSKLFGEECHTPTTFLTFRFDKEFSNKKNQLFENQKIDRKFTRVLNMFDDFLSKNANGRFYSERISLQEIKKQIRRNRILQKFGTLFSGKINNLEITFYEDGRSVCFVDYFNSEKKCYKREEYSKNGTLIMIAYFDTKTGCLSRQEFVNENNMIYLEKHYEYNPEKKDVQFTHMNWYSEMGALHFSDESDLRRHWIEVLQAESDKPKLFLVDSRPQDKHIFRVKKAPASYYAAIIHNKHYGENKYQIKGRYKEVFSQMPNLDAVFFITEEQMEDFELISGKQKIFFFTPHTIAKPLDKQVLNVPSKKNKAVIISRLAPMKNLTHAIKAFRLVVNEIPEAQLEIFGSGEEEHLIKAEIEKSSLQNNVFLKGYTQNPDAEFQKAWLTISTSHFEGFGLSNMEALSNGCPVVTYDYDYGARSLVKDNKNGFVVEQYNIEQLAEKIVLLMKDEKLHEEFSKRAFEMAEKYSTHNYMRNWSVALHDMIKIREEKQSLSNAFSSKLPFTIRENQTRESVLTLELHCPMQIDENYHLQLIGLDRKNKALVVSAAPDESGKRFNISFDKGIHVEKIRANKTRTLDFYLEISNANHIKVLKRLSVDQTEMASPFSAKEYEIVPYTTVKGNYSWTLNGKD
ncbi:MULTISPECIES: alpha-glucosyltransferase N-terminal domain-containing protein [Bacillus]|uniref:alpha-glucosyltransferase N-terminal domain-containing protein n=1 Tax=Bacillus TaxID=1386 RepID=UPI000687D23D|nr:MULTISPECIES: alpha-glucosyltransferase N-terminal domain-containing protein [Bacillus]QHZ48992.1 glycosyltransferase [Bacillus sp. NSP9.1]